MEPVIYYCYDAYCGWCYGFSTVMKKIAEAYKYDLSFEVLSGGMIPAGNPRPIAATAGYINEAYHRVEALTGVKFGDAFLWHIRHPEESDWFPHSEKAAVALCIFKELFPLEQVQIAADLQYALHYEGRDLTDDEAYRHLLDRYTTDVALFYSKLNSEEYKEKAHYEFALCKQLQVSAFPAVLLQTGESKFYGVTRGYTGYADIKARIETILTEISKENVG